MRALGFALRSLVRQPARATLGILGVTAAAALLFDMLLLSQGLIVSMGDLLERTGFDVRVTTTAELPRTAPPIDRASAAVASISALPDVKAAIGVRFVDVTIDRAGKEPITGTMQGVVGTAHPWSVLKGRDIATRGAGSPSGVLATEAGRGVNANGRPPVIINQHLASALGLDPGATLTVNASCESELDVLPPATFEVIGIASFPFELSAERTIAGDMTTLDAACGGNGADQAHMLVVTSAGKADQAAAVIQQLRPDLRAATNAQMLGRIEQGGFTYFRQISTVLTTVTVAFALLLICVLLTVSVNQRLGEIAALRALGFSRSRVIADVLAESVLIVGTGGVLSLPAGLVLASWLDRILKRMPNLPADLHFFVFEPGALKVHIVLLVITAITAALYPMTIVARLPIAATLRNEVTS
jgi:ABC-type lipoprotein release transport system permease subunit